jgi:hypothetical protein
MARTPDRKREALWRGRVNRQLLSGLSISQFCSQEQCAVSAFYRWKRHFDLPAHPDKCSALPAPRSTFLPVTVRLIDNDGYQPVPIEADLPNGVRLRIPTANVRLACRLVRAVARARTGSGGST